MIAIIGVLVALLLPAVQAAREAARRMSCSNNLRQIGLAIHNYENAHKVYPPGSFWRWFSLNNEQFLKGSILLHLLPYLEHQNIYDQVDFKQQFTDGLTIPGTSTPIATQEISTYLCPSDTREFPNPSGYALHSYAASTGPTAHADNGACSCATWNSWNAYALKPYGVADQFAGPFHRMAVNCEPRDVRDGLTKTIFFGEVRPTCSIHQTQGWFVSNDGQGLTSTLVPINYDSCSQDPAEPDGCKRYCNWNTELGFKSSHPGGALFLMGDGSVHFLDDAIDHWTYQYLGAKADGKSVAWPE